jgi:hypothetical protein
MCWDVSVLGGKRDMNLGCEEERLKYEEEKRDMY